MKWETQHYAKDSVPELKREIDAFCGPGTSAALEVELVRARTLAAQLIVWGRALRLLSDAGAPDAFVNEVLLALNVRTNAFLEKNLPAESMGSADQLMDEALNLIKCGYQGAPVKFPQWVN